VSNNPCISEIEAKNILNKSRISEVEYAINPYVGCQHGCIYCYAQFMKRYSGHIQDDWGSFVDVKINAAEVLENQLRRRRNPDRPSVLFSSVTDPYQQIEEQYYMTGNCIRLLQDYDFPVSILTKSDLVLRDLDLLGMNKGNEVGMTIISLDEDVRKTFEPGAPPLKGRLAALREISDVGISTYAFVGPIIPYLSISTIHQLLRELGDIGVSHVFLDRLNMKAGNQTTIKTTIKNHYPDIASKILQALHTNDSYYSTLRDELEDVCRSTGINAKIIF